MQKMRRVQPRKRLQPLVRIQQRKMRKRWKNSAGESLAEALVAVLIMAFGALMLASMVQSSTRIVQTSNTGMTKVYNAEAEAERFLGGSSNNPGTGQIDGGKVTLSETGSAGTPIQQIGGTKLDSTVSGVQIYYDEYSNITAFRRTISLSGTTDNP